MGRKLRVKLITIPWELEVPTLTLASLAAVTPESHFDVCIVDTLREQLVFDEPTDLVGITASTPSIYEAYALADRYRAKGIKVVMGGHHATAMPQEALEHADAIVCGEGEGSWMRILDEFLTNPSLVEGIYQDEPPPLASLPQPRIDLMKLDRYQSFYYPVIASRGCPYACSFCFAKRMTLGYRTHPISHVLEQIRRRPKWIRGVYFVDDNIAGDLEYTRELFKQLEHYNIQFGMQARHEFSQDPANLRMARRAGCGLVSSGYESVNQMSLNKTGKQASVSLYKEVIKNIQDEGMIASGNWMFGFDWDTPEGFAETWEFLRDSGIMHSSFTTEIPFPGTTIYNRYLREGRILTTDYREYVGKDKVVVKPKGMTPEQLAEGIRWLVLKYYSPSHRRHLARIAAKNDNFLPAFQGIMRQPLISFLNYFQVFLYTYRMVPALRAAYFGAMPYMKHRFVGDLARGTNFWGKTFPEMNDGPEKVVSSSRFFTNAGTMRPGRKTLNVVEMPPAPLPVASNAPS